MQQQWWCAADAAAWVPPAACRRQQAAAQRPGVTPTVLPCLASPPSLAALAWVGGARNHVHMRLGVRKERGAREPALQQGKAFELVLVHMLPLADAGGHFEIGDGQTAPIDQEDKRRAPARWPLRRGPLVSLRQPSLIPHSCVGWDVVDMPWEADGGHVNAEGVSGRGVDPLSCRRRGPARGGATPP